MDDKNTKTTATTDSTVKDVDTTTSKASALTIDSTSVASTVTASQPAKAVATPTTTGGGETQTMADTTKKIDPKFDGCEAYVVQKGDALVDIADKYNVGLNQLRYFNGVPKATFKISEGQTIYIPKGEVKVPVGA